MEHCHRRWSKRAGTVVSTRSSPYFQLQGRFLEVTIPETRVPVAAADCESSVLFSVLRQSDQTTTLSGFHLIYRRYLGPQA